MSLTTCKLHFTNQASKTVYATPALLRHLKLRTDRSVHVRLGGKQTRIGLKRINRKGKHLFIPSGIRGLISLPQAKMTMVGSSQQNEIQLGPLIGIFTTSEGRRTGLPFGSKSSVMKYYLRANKSNALYFAFAPEDIDWNKETVTAHFLNQGGGWVRRVVPFPDVIYNRVTSRKLEQSGSMLTYKERFVRKSIPIFNWNFYDKWQVYNILRKESEASKHVPDTCLDPSSNEMKEMLEKHRFVYLKPSGGSLGKGIFRLTYHTKKGYFVRYRAGNKNVLQRFTQFDRMMRVLQRRKGMNLDGHVLQQGIRLIELDGCPIDFRFHLNKNGENEWVVAGIGAKKAGKGSVTTHVRTGGQLMTPEYVLNRVYGESKGQEMLKKAKQTTIELAKAIERNDSHLIGELGFDIGIDVNGDIWMFEANAKPGRSIFKHPALKEEGSASLQYILDYCIYLSRNRRRRSE